MPNGLVPGELVVKIQAQVLNPFNEIENRQLTDFYNLCVKAGVSFKDLAKILQFYNQNAVKIHMLSEKLYYPLFDFIKKSNLISNADLSKLQEIYFRGKDGKFNSNDQDFQNFLMPVFARAEIISKLTKSKNAPFDQTALGKWDFTQSIPEEIILKYFTEAPTTFDRLGFAWDVIGSEISGTPPPELMLLPEFGRFLKLHQTTDAIFNRQLTHMINATHQIAATIQLRGVNRMDYQIFRDNLFILIKHTTDIPDQRLTAYFYAGTYRENSWDGGQERQSMKNVVMGLSEIINKPSASEPWFNAWFSSMKNEKPMQRLVRYLINEPRNTVTEYYFPQTYYEKNDVFCSTSSIYDMVLGGVSKILATKTTPQKIAAKFDFFLENNYSYGMAKHLTVISAFFNKKPEQVIVDFNAVLELYRNKAQNSTFNWRYVDSVNFLKIMYLKNLTLTEAEGYFAMDFKGSSQAFLFYVMTGKGLEEFSNLTASIQEKVNEKYLDHATANRIAQKLVKSSAVKSFIENMENNESPKFEETLNQAVSLFIEARDKIRKDPNQFVDYSLLARSVEFVFSLGLPLNYNSVNQVITAYKNHTKDKFYGNSNFGYFFLSASSNIDTTNSSVGIDGIGPSAALFTFLEIVPW
jgi:hypothetical protein